MSSVSDTSYLHEATAAANRSHHRLLDSMYLNEFNVLEPPEGGWPCIPPNGRPVLDKTDEVFGNSLHTFSVSSEPWQLTLHSSLL
jgi:hypothetical protein